jgi:hypothetical protein
MSTGGPEKPLLHRLLGWPSLAIGAAMLCFGAVVQDWVLAVLGGCVTLFAITELIATPSGRR